MSNAVALDNFHKAREYYLVRRFDLARTTMQRYRQAIDYRQFKHQDNRTETNPEISVVIVGYCTGPQLLSCIHSVLAQQDSRHEIILVDNGLNEAIHPHLAQLPICWVSPPINLLPSEGRNLGATFANSDILVFLDDDALMAPGYLSAVQQRAKSNQYLALRGRIQPKSTTATSQPKHYDLGETEQSGEFNLEGNMVIRRSLFQKLCGFDPLMFGHEGKALTQQWRQHFPVKDISYCPELIIHHDWAEADNLTSKRERQALGKDYLFYLKEHALNAGVTIILRVGAKLTEAQGFLEGLAKHNSYKPIEVLLWVNDSHQALTTIRVYLTKFFVRIVPAKINILKHLGKQARYENILIIDLPIKFEDDVLNGWIQNKKSDLKAALLCDRQQLAKLSDLTFTIELGQLASRLEKLTHIQTTGLPPLGLDKFTRKVFQNPLETTHAKNVKISSKASSGKDKDIKLSIIIPVFNKAETIEKALNSVKCIGRKDIECIVIDDLSTDNSREIITEISRKINNVVSIFNKTNIGAGASRNIGIKKAVGEYIMFLDADDCLNGSAVSQALELAEEHGSDLVRGKIEGLKIDGTRQILSKEYLLHDEMVPATRWLNNNTLWFYWYFTANLYRRSFLSVNYILFSESVRNEDPLFLCKCFLYANKITLYPSTIYYYFIEESPNKRVGVDYLKGWVCGYYSIFQLIRSQKRQAAFYLAQIPALKKQLLNIIEQIEKDEALVLLTCISSMYKNFENEIGGCSDDMEIILKKMKPWQVSGYSDNIQFAKMISGRSADAIYKLLEHECKQ